MLVNTLSCMCLAVLTEVKVEGLTVLQRLPILCTVEEGTVFA